MALVLALDVGDRRVGVALGDDSTKIVTPLGAYVRAKGEAEREILKLINERNISLVVAGLPLSEEGRSTDQSLRVEAFCRRLHRRASFELKFIDEFLTTEEAKQRFNWTQKKEREYRQKGVLDALAASIILEAYFAC